MEETLRKIPTLFRREWGRTVPAVKTPNPECEWVFDKFIPTVPTIKWDGTSCRVTDNYFWRRHTKEPHKPPPAHWEPAQDFPTKNGDYPGWVPVDENDPNDQHHIVGLKNAMDDCGGKPPNGTYELVGPKIQDNPYGLGKHLLVPHGHDIVNLKYFSYESIKGYLLSNEVEGIVFYELRGDRMAKITRKDFGYRWPLEDEDGRFGRTYR